MHGALHNRFLEHIRLRFFTVQNLHVILRRIAKPIHLFAGHFAHLADTGDQVLRTIFIRTVMVEHGLIPPPSHQSG